MKFSLYFKISLDLHCAYALRRSFKKKFRFLHLNLGCWFIVALSEVPVSGRLSLVLRLMCGYFTLFPKFSQTVLDFSSFLDGLEKAEEQRTEETLETDGASYLYLLHLLSLSGVQLEDLIDRASVSALITTPDIHLSFE